MYYEERSKYTQRLSRQYPGLFVILLDQSASMREIVEDQSHKFVQSFSQNNQPATKADVATAAINTIIYELISSAGLDEMTATYKNSAYISILGYNDRVTPLLSKASGLPPTEEPIGIATLAENPKGFLTMRTMINSPIGLKEIVKKQPYWITADSDGNTKMALAFERAKAIIDRWLHSSPEQISPRMGMQASRDQCFPPIVINITDAQNNGRENPVEVADEIRSRSTLHGSCLIFNCHFSKEKGRATIFPGESREVRNLDQYGFAEMMFHMSSPIPDMLRADASTFVRRPITPDTRCYVYNADPEILIRFLKWGTLGQGNMGTHGRG